MLEGILYLESNLPSLSHSTWSATILAECKPLFPKLKVVRLETPGNPQAKLCHCL